MKLLKRKPILFFIIILAIVIGVVLTILTPSLITRRRQPVIPSPTPSVSALPTLSIVPVNPSQKLIINWHDLIITPPERLPTYEIISPLIDTPTIQLIAKELGFSDFHLKQTLTPGNLLYVNNNLSLFASVSQNQIQFTNSSPTPTKTGFTSSTQVNQKIESYLDIFFPNSTFDLQNQEYFLHSSNEIYPQKTTTVRANLTRVNYRQTINNLPLLTSASSNSIISFLFDNNQTLRSLEINAGFSQISPTTPLKLLDFPSLVERAATTALPFSLDATVDITSLIQGQSVVTLDLDEIRLVYFNSPESRQILPVFLLQGTLTTTGATKIPATYLVPAFR